MSDEEEPYELWDVDGGHAAADPAKLGVQTRTTLRPSCVIRVSDLKPGQIRRVKLSMEWELPRAFDCTSPNDHYGKLYAHLSPVDFRAKMLQIAKDLQHEAVPPKLQDDLRRVATSSMATAGKQTHGWKRATAANSFGFCARGCCMGKRCPETLEHIITDCPHALALWSAVLLRWNAHTGEAIEYNDKRVTMLGDRGEHRSEATEEPWRMLHAVVVQVLLRTARSAKECGEAGPATPNQLLSAVRRDMEKAMCNRRRRLARDRKHGLFEQRWREVCDATAQNLRCAALDDPADPHCRTVNPRRRVYVDGSMRQGQRQGATRAADSAQQCCASDEEAGWAVVTCDLHPDARCGNFYAANETVTAAEAGTVCLEVGTAGYRGATTKSNNTAELTALLRAVEGELARPHAPVEICADSKYALGHASGKWLVPRKNTELVRRLRERVRDLVRQRGGPKYVTLSHVRAHARTPGNEAADQLAKEVARDGTVSNDAMRALTIASTAHRRVRGESDQTSWQPPHQPHQPPHQAHQHTGTGAPGRGFGDG